MSMSAATSPSPSSSPVADHVPFATAPETRALCDRARSLNNRADYAGALPLLQQVVDLAHAAMAANRTPQTALDVVFAITQLGGVKRDLGDLPGAQAGWSRLWLSVGKLLDPPTRASPKPWPISVER